MRHWGTRSVCCPLDLVPTYYKANQILNFVQTFSEDRYRGRVIAAQSMVSALRTLGFLVIGVLAALTSVTLAIGLFGAAVVAMGIATLLFRPHMRDLR